MTRRSLLLFALFAGLVAGACAQQSVSPEAHEGDGGQDHEGHEEECTDEQLERVDEILALTGDEAAGAQVFADVCGESFCHGADGVSGPGAPLSEEVPEHTAEELGCVMLIGPGEMPSLRSLGNQELADVLAYVRATF